MATISYDEFIKILKDPSITNDQLQNNVFPNVSKDDLQKIATEYPAVSGRINKYLDSSVSSGASNADSTSSTRSPIKFIFESEEKELEDQLAGFDEWNEANRGKTSIPKVKISSQSTTTPTDVKDPNVIPLPTHDEYRPPDTTPTTNSLDLPSNGRVNVVSGMAEQENPVTDPIVRQQLYGTRQLVKDIVDPSDYMLDNYTYDPDEISNKTELSEKAQEAIAKTLNEGYPSSTDGYKPSTAETSTVKTKSSSTSGATFENGRAMAEKQAVDKARNTYNANNSFDLAGKKDSVSSDAYFYEETHPTEASALSNSTDIKGELRGGSGTTGITANERQTLMGTGAVKAESSSVKSNLSEMPIVKDEPIRGKEGGYPSSTDGSSNNLSKESVEKGIEAGKLRNLGKQLEKDFGIKGNLETNATNDPFNSEVDKSQVTKDAYFYEESHTTGASGTEMPIVKDEPIRGKEGGYPSSTDGYKPSTAGTSTVKTKSSSTSGTTFENGRAMAEKQAVDKARNTYNANNSFDLAGKSDSVPSDAYFQEESHTTGASETEMPIVKDEPIRGKEGGYPSSTDGHKPSTAGLAGSKAMETARQIYNNGDEIGDSGVMGKSDVSTNSDAWGNLSGLAYNGLQYLSDESNSLGNNISALNVNTDNIKKSISEAIQGINLNSITSAKVGDIGNAFSSSILNLGSWIDNLLGQIDTFKNNISKIGDTDSSSSNSTNGNKIFKKLNTSSPDGSVTNTKSAGSSSTKSIKSNNTTKIINNTKSTSSKNVSAIRSSGSGSSRRSSGGGPSSRNINPINSTTARTPSTPTNRNLINASVGKVNFTEIVAMKDNLNSRTTTNSSEKANYGLIGVSSYNNEYYYKIIDKDSGKTYYVLANDKVKIETDVQDVLKVNDNTLVLNKASTELENNNFVRLAEKGEMYLVKSVSEVGDLKFAKVLDSATGKEYYVPISDTTELISLNKLSELNNGGEK